MQSIRAYGDFQAPNNCASINSHVIPIIAPAIRRKQLQLVAANSAIAEPAQ
jgi:hypothetical protein